MLPSTGYFKAINCPFYENGYCERPYCHFRHSRRDGGSTSAIVASDSNQTTTKSQNADSATIGTTNSDVIQQLVSEAVKKVLADQNVTDTENIVNKVVEGLKPKLVPNVLSTTPSINQEIISQESAIGKHLDASITPTLNVSPCVYNPTPIAELKKRHIPITAYEPTRESKAVKRKSPDVERPWMDVIRNITSIKESKVSYTPTAINQTVSTEINSLHNYIPTIKSETSLNLYDINSSSNDSYIPEKKQKKEFYCPKPKKRREEYVPRKPKVPLKTKQNAEEEYDMLDEFLCGSESNTNTGVDEDSDDLMDIDPKFSDDDEDEDDDNDDDDEDDDDDDDDDDGGNNDNDDDNEDNEEDAIEKITKEDEKLDNINRKISHDEKENKELKKSNLINSESDDKNSNRSNKSHQEKTNRHKESSKSKSDVSKTKSKSSEKSTKENVKHKHKDKVDSKHSKNKNDDLKHTKNKEDNLKQNRNSEEDSRQNKNKQEDSKRKNKEKVEEKRDKEKEKEKEKNKDKQRHSSKSNRSVSYSKDNKSKEKERDKIKNNRDCKDNSHRNKKDSKSEKIKKSYSKDLKDNKKESKDKSKYKTDEKNKYKSKSSSSNSKSKSSKQSHKISNKSVSHSSHKSRKSNDKSLVEREESISDRNDEKSDREEKGDSPEYEEFSPFYDEQLLETTDSDHDVEEECRKIFQEYEVSDHPKDVSSKAPLKPEVEEPGEIFKKRVAHPSAVTNMTKQFGPTQPPKRLPNPQQRMYERWRMMKEVAAEKAAEKAAANKASEMAIQKKFENSSTLVHNDHQVNGNGRIRIAQVPYAMSLALEKKKVLEKAAKIETKTVAQNKKGSARVAHVPQVVPQLIRPEPLQISGTQKFPLNVRQFYVNAMQNICVQIYTNADDAAQRAVREELACYERCKAVNVYKNSCMLTVHRLRKEVDQKREETSVSNSGMISHEAVLAGKVKGSWSVIKPRKLVTDFKGVSLYNMLTKWIMTEQELKDNGYPRPHPEGPKGRAKLYVSNVRGQSIVSKVPNERFCCRCNKGYIVDKYGLPTRKENCIYHYARKFTFRGESKYMCCKQDGSTDGCCDATTHVSDNVDIENLRGYVSTFDKNTSAEEQGIFALDCEMCYTTQGLELTRVTVINEDYQVVYETLVKPSHPIIDFNTRFSGISEKDMVNVTTTLLDVQATLLSMFSSKTILVGHSLESDFKALKLLHNTVVDTSIMFPHKNGPPYKRALKNLCSEYLRKIIQNDLGGHDSKEDANACMELILWKVKEEAKLQ